jgi:REase associating with pPIWI_RE/pPIWI_RE three-gene island domain Y
MARVSLSKPALAAGNDVGLPTDILILHLIATGIIRSAERIAKGKLIDTEYPIPLQLGLDRFNMLRYRQNLSLIKSVPDLLAWCQRPLKEWSLDYTAAMLDPDDRLLIEQFPTEICENLACATSDVEADLSERRFMEKVFSICKDTSNPEAYTDFRRLLIEKPAMTALELLQCRDTYPSLEILQELLEAAYEEAPLDYMVRGTFTCCPTCGNLQQPDVTRTKLLCEDERCRQASYARGFVNKVRVLQARDRVYWLRRDLRRFVMMPGRAEIRLEKRLQALGLKPEMWPEFDSYDLRVTLPDGKVLAIDVKDWANPFLLARRVRGIPLSPRWDAAYYVFPFERKRTQPDYVRAFVNTCNSMGQIGIGGSLKAAFENDFLKIVRKALSGGEKSSAN